MTQANFFADAPVIHSYSRAQAIEDGMLVDVSETAREAGFRVAVAITREAWESVVAWTERDAERSRHYQDEAGRLWDVVWMAMLAARRTRGVSRSNYRLRAVPRPGHGRKQIRDLSMVSGPGDNGEHVITIMMPTED